jgi:hypothetical protein
MLLAAALAISYEITPAPGGTVKVTENVTAETPELREALPRLENPREALKAWVEGSARAVAGYYGRLPVPRVILGLRRASRGGVVFGHTEGERGGARIDVDLGPETTTDSFARDWVLVHELVHTAIPRMNGSAVWLDEGLATYVEPIARARAGIATPERVWADLAWGLPQGLPSSGDRGLDRTHSWGRTYWGGALFAFLADVGIREKTANKRSLRDALVGLLDAGGDVTKGWPLRDVLAAMDKATGTTVLTDLHARMGEDPMDPDLPALFARLGVRVNEGRVAYDDAAPLASIRKTLPTGVAATPVSAGGASPRS